MTSRWCWRRCHNAAICPQRLRIANHRFEQIAAGHVPLVVVNYLGLPSVAVPSHLDASGPVGVQLIGRPLRAISAST